MNIWLMLFITLMYLVLLFVVAYIAEKKQILSDRWSPFVYALSIGVYCTAWTFYGSIGRASISGPDFLAIYVGPILLMPLCWGFYRKIIKISKVQKITSIADFISARYGKNISIGAVVAVVCIVGIIPYISLQIKAIADSFDILTINSTPISSISTIQTWKPFIVTIVLGFFIMLFGTSKLDASEKHRGLVSAIAFESIVKLLAFFIGAIFIIKYILSNYSSIDIQQNKQLQHLFTFEKTSGYLSWFGMSILSFTAFIFLPRQFQLGVIENKDDAHLKTAIWVFPTYLILINLLVIPVAVAGILFYQGQTYNPDYTLLSLPGELNAHGISMIVFLGGFSAATGMIIVETIALSTMFSNNILIPIILSIPVLKNKFFNQVLRSIKLIRRVSILFLLLLSYLYYQYVSGKYSLVSIGLISFTAVAQFAPSVIFGIYWKRANKLASLVGIILGISIWFFTLVMPTLITAGLLPNTILESGIAGISWLRPHNLFGVAITDHITHAFFWSIFFNLFAFISISLFTEADEQEAPQAELFVNIDQYSSSYEQSFIRSGNVNIVDLRSLLASFIGDQKSKRLYSQYFTRNQLEIPDDNQKADQSVITYTEKILSGVIGAASARVILQSMMKDEVVRMNDVVNLLKESQQILLLNKELSSKSTELSKAYDALSNANVKLRQIDLLKDEFLYTVTHELRTPLTSVRAFTEIMHDHPDMDETKRQEFLKVMVTELERLSKLITQVLDLEKLESGKQSLHLSEVDPYATAKRVVDSFLPVFEADLQKISIQSSVDTNVMQDEDLIERVLVNIIGNAKKYIPKTNGIVKVSLTQFDNFIQYEIEDNGLGIPEEQRLQVFDKFYQINQSKKSNVGGSGLGLSICKKIVDLHNGFIHVDESSMGGAKFILQIPMKQHDNS
jgi:Na+/proline symporter/signal transduction histidine kinase